MNTARKRLCALLAPGLALVLWAMLGAWLFWLTLDASEQASVAAQLGPVLAPRVILLVLWCLAAGGFAAWLSNRLFDGYVATPLRLAEATRALASDPDVPDLEPAGGELSRRLAEAINALAGQRRRLHEDSARRIAEASREVELQRNRLAALMSELRQSVIVCNREGRILLYNTRARQLLDISSQSAAAPGGARMIGLGRSIHSVFDRAMVAHGLEVIEQRLAREGDIAADSSAQFVTSTPAGRLLRVQMAPVLAVQGEAGEGAGQGANGEAGAGAGAGAGETFQARAPALLDGFVMMLDDVTAHFEEQSRRDRVLLELTEGTRASLGSMRAALDMLGYEDLDRESRARFEAIVHEEVTAMGARLESMVASTSQEFVTRWPLQDMLGADLVSAAARRIEFTTGKRVACAEVDYSLWLKIDSYSLLQALSFVAVRATEAFELSRLQLRLLPAPRGAYLDLMWLGHAASTETVMGWQVAPMEIGEERSPLSVRDVVERHGGEIWLERDRARHLAYLRFLLPLAGVQAQGGSALPQPARASRPEFYDFDLFRSSESSRALEDRALSELSYTVFDTETTGLNPSEGDEIVQIGATRIVNGRLLRGECFEQLVNPRRRISEASIAIHGIQPASLQHQPLIEQVLPVFHAFAQDTVLVGHNLAFDMRFLQMKEAKAGVRFDHPVLDTLLLSAVVHQEQSSHRLEAIAERLGVQVQGRHTAIGDALLAAEVFLKLIPLLREQGIVTLGQALAAARRTLHARLRY